MRASTNTVIVLFLIFYLRGLLMLHISGLGIIAEYFAIDEDWNNLEGFYSIRNKESLFESIPSAFLQSYFWTETALNSEELPNVLPSVSLVLSFLSIGIVVDTYTHQKNAWARYFTLIVFLVEFIVRSGFIGWLLFFPIQNNNPDNLTLVLYFVCLFWMCLHMLFLMRYFRSYENIFQQFIASINTFISPIFVLSKGSYEKFDELLAEHLSWIFPLVLWEIMWFAENRKYLVAPLIMTIAFAVHTMLIKPFGVLNTDGGGRIIANNLGEWRVSVFSIHSLTSTSPSEPRKVETTQEFSFNESLDTSPIVSNKMLKSVDMVE